MHSDTRAIIAGTGSFVPEKVLTNDDFARMVDTSDEWITTRTGIKSRHIADNGMTTSDMAAEAGRRALADARRLPGGRRPRHPRDVHGRPPASGDRLPRADEARA